MSHSDKCHSVLEHERVIFCTDKKCGSIQESKLLLIKSQKSGSGTGTE
jgi:hypothetical protein